MQKILTFFIFLLLVYSIVKSRIIDNDSVKNMFNAFSSPSQSKEGQEGALPSQGKPLELKGNFLEKTISNIASNVLKTPQGKDFFGKLIQPQYDVNNGMNLVIKGNSDEVVRSLFMINDIKEGIGPKICCGQRAKVSYKIYRNDGSEGLEQKEINVGGSDFSPNLDSVVIGMSKGGHRSAVLKDVRNSDATNIANDNSQMQSEIEVKEVYPANFDVAKLSIFDDSYGYTIPILCGEDISFKLRIKKLDNSEIYSSQAIPFKVGAENNEWPEFFSYALYNKILSGSRFVITPTIYIDKLASRLSLNLGDEKYVILEFYDTKIEPKK